MSEDQKVFFGGIPCDVDVQKIVDAIKPEPGMLVPYWKLEEIIGHSKNESRFGSVVWNWRNRLRRELNLLTEGVPNEGILILTTSRRVDHVGRRMGKGARAIKRAYNEASTTEREELSIAKRRQLDHYMHLSGALIMLGKKMEKTKALPAEEPDKEEP